MSQPQRRTFVLQLVAGTSALVSTGLRADEPPTQLTESDAYARSMGFKLDTAQVDKVKYPRHDVSQHCSLCQLFSGKPGEPIGPCSFYGGRLVPINGWCRNFKVRKT